MPEFTSLNILSQLILTVLLCCVLMLLGGALYSRGVIRGQVPSVLWALLTVAPLALYMFLAVHGPITAATKPVGPADLSRAARS